MTILDYIKHRAQEHPDKPAIIYGEKVITYRDLYPTMLSHEPLPIPLLGHSWDGDFLLLTSGTTGQRKSIIISQKTVLANSQNLIAGQGYSHNTIFVIAGDMTHLGCWSKIFPVLMQGATLLILKYGIKDIDTFFHAFDHSLLISHYSLFTESTFATFLVPSSIRILLQFASDRLATLADKLEFLETGAAPIPLADMQRLCKLLPNTRLYNTYASTEAGIVATFNFNASSITSPGLRNNPSELCIPGCVGQPFPDHQVIITSEGHITCNGMDTNDLGNIDDQGRLHILGRDDDVINVGGYKVNPTEVEDVALSFPGISDCICIAMPHPVLGQAPAILFTQHNQEQILNKRDLARFIASKLDRYKVPLTYTHVDHIERTFNGKLNRKSYSIDN